MPPSEIINFEGESEILYSQSGCLYERCDEAIRNEPRSGVIGPTSAREAEVGLN